MRLLPAYIPGTPCTRTCVVPAPARRDPPEPVPLVHSGGPWTVAPQRWLVSGRLAVQVDHLQLVEGPHHVSVRHPRGSLSFSAGVDKPTKSIPQSKMRYFA